jgi:hypothetical protein
MNAVQRDLGAPGHGFQLFPRKITVLTLDRSKIVENQPPSSRISA